MYMDTNMILLIIYRCGGAVDREKHFFLLCFLFVVYETLYFKKVGVCMYAIDIVIIQVYTGCTNHGHHAGTI